MPRPRLLLPWLLCAAACAPGPLSAGASSGQATTSAGSGASTGTGGATSDWSSTGPLPADPAGPCPATVDGDEVVGCGLSPYLTLVGADAAAVYAVTPHGAFYRVDLATHDKLLLFAVDNPNGYYVEAAFTAQLQGDRIFFEDQATPDDRWTEATFAIGTSAPVATPVSVLGGNTALGAHDGLRADADFVYLDYFDGPEMAQGGLLYRAPRGGGAPSLVDGADGDWSMPVGLDDAFVYHYSGVDQMLRRSPKAGGAATVLGGPIGNHEEGTDLDFDGKHVYWFNDAIDGGGIQRMAASGGAIEQVLAPTAMMDPIYALRAGPDAVYFLHATDETAVKVLARTVGETGGGGSEDLFRSPSLPVFGGGAAYAVRVTDGLDAPVEGLIVRHTSK